MSAPRLANHADYKELKIPTYWHQESILQARASLPILLAICLDNLRSSCDMFQHSLKALGLSLLLSLADVHAAPTDGVIQRRNTLGTALTDFMYVVLVLCFFTFSSSDCPFSSTQYICVCIWG